MKNHSHVYIYIYICYKAFSGPRMTGDRLWYCEMLSVL